MFNVCPCGEGGGYSKSVDKPDFEFLLERSPGRLDGGQLLGFVVEPDERVRDEGVRKQPNLLVCFVADPDAIGFELLEEGNGCPGGRVDAIEVRDGELVPSVGDVVGHDDCVEV